MAAAASARLDWARLPLPARGAAALGLGAHALTPDADLAAAGGGATAVGASVPSCGALTASALKSIKLQSIISWQPVVLPLLRVLQCLHAARIVYLLRVQT